MRNETIDALLETRRGYVVAAAGCGKTEAIAKAIEHCGDSSRQLVLTHTHAGVKAIRDRLLRFHVPESRFRVDTIAGWCLRYAASFPQLPGLDETTPPAGDWSLVYPAAEKLLRVDAVQQVVENSYAGVFVDEYQDCTKSQHAVILQLADLLPCRILGDPLQGIFGFNEPLIDWNADVTGAFEALPPLQVPHRWRDNVPLGRRLTAIREALLAGSPIDLRVPPLKWRRLPKESQDVEIAAQLSACDDLYASSGSVVAIRRWPSECHAIAGKLGGRYTCMEEMDCKDLLRFAKAIEEKQGLDRCDTLFDFADLCMTGLATPLKTIRQSVASGRAPVPSRLRSYQDIAIAVAKVAGTSDLGPVSHFLRLLEGVPNRRIFRRELWREMGRALSVHGSGRGSSLWEAAWELRNRLRRQGRTVERRTVSRTLLIKGLEFDHTVILDACEHDAKNFYVAATRPTKSLTICSATPRMSFEA
jgi:DNA helicase-2/ATP-dependent DNA helicase PcrA